MDSAVYQAWNDQDHSIIAWLPDHVLDDVMEFNESCTLQGKTYYGSWSGYDREKWFFRLDEWIDMDDELWKNPLDVESDDLVEDGEQVQGWFSAVRGRYEPVNGGDYEEDEEAIF